MERLWDVLLDALIDCAKLTPFLLATVFLMEYLEHRAADKLVGAVRRAGRFGPLLGAAAGCIPQCGFSAACAQLFNGGFVSAGTLVAVFLATSDEALPILLGHPDALDTALLLLAVKAALGMAAGYAVDALWRRDRQQAALQLEAGEHRCECRQGAPLGRILLEAVRRTLSILLFLFIFSAMLGLLIEGVGRERLASFLLPGPFQPLLAALFGFIPNCAASVLLTQLYLDGMISFGSAVAGLGTAAGVGLLVLLRSRHRARTYAIVLGGTYAAAALCGMLLQLF
ncbi:MAG TPA: arsenic efflux protein [Candidatus Aphodomorpha intestinavium]|uniref:Arsenic efflux protein n=1 Tax=Candidatus Aphodomorpha intestinavium TaxID=2840672 RepID=A0A9D1SST9_9FIRM|nr:arsenic efflux protein [Candidatus Aphodomorpha intestinavium]